MQGSSFVLSSFKTSKKCLPFFVVVSVLLYPKLKKYLLRRLCYVIVARSPGKDNLNEEEHVFLRSFGDAYKDLDVESDLKLELPEGTTKSLVLRNFLVRAFSEEKARFFNTNTKNDKNTVELYFSAISRMTGRVIGYVGVRKSKNGDKLYIHQLAVDSDCQGMGVGKALVFAAADDRTERIEILTRGVNVKAINFYKRLGFELCPIHECQGAPLLDPKLYAAMTWTKGENLSSHGISKF